MSFKKNTVYFILCSIGLVFVSCGKNGNPNPAPPPATSKTFTNPLKSGADPWVIKKDSFYYYTQTLGNSIAIWKTRAMSKLATGTKITVFTPLPSTPNSSNIWAPELHWLDNKWYIYYSAGSGNDSTQRTWVLENSNPDPMAGTWADKGRIYGTDADFWAIDGSVMEYNGNRYFIWSGRPDLSVQNQNIYIAKMSNPWTLESPSVMISRPEFAWEKTGGPVNEAPEFLQGAGKFFIIYSASGCWTDDYTLGRLTLTDNGNPLIPLHWTKSSNPVFSKKTEGNVYGPGHNAFFKSPDGKEDWIIYHANTNSNEGCADKRNIRIQKISWNSDGSPHFGMPAGTGSTINVPSGE